jgi:hypothetical protein
MTSNSLKSRVLKVERSLPPSREEAPFFSLIFTDDPAYFQPGHENLPLPDEIQTAQCGDQIWNRAETETADEFYDRVLREVGEAPNDLLLFNPTKETK